MSTLSSQYGADRLRFSSVATKSARVPLSDAELMDRAAQGDRAAFGQIISRYQNRLYNALLYLTGDGEEAADLARQTFTRGFATIAEFRRGSQPYTWLFRLGANLAISSLRKSRRPRNFTAQSESQRMVMEALGRVEADYRAVLVMRDLEGFDFQQMSKVLDLPVGTVKSRLFRARLALRDEMQGQLHG
jgi:RNA polymerase sigma-70 factor (ECF subfamily)